LTFTVTQDIMQLGLDRLIAALESREVQSSRAELMGTEELDRLTTAFTSAEFVSEVEARNMVCHA
jgi:hypothetical protein